MAIFLTLLLKLIPLYIIIGLGFIAARFLGAQRETIAKLLIYIIAPIVIFYGIIQTKLTLPLLALPLLFFILCCTLSLTFLGLAHFFWPKGDKTKNLLGFAAGAGNTGYFGLPVGLFIFGEQALGPIVLCTLGYILYENTLGFFITARANHTPKESFYKLLKLPTIYAFLFGVILNLTHIPIGVFITTTLENFKGVYTVFGMMIIGMGLATVRFDSFDLKLFITAFTSKFVVWPLVVSGIIFADDTYFHLYDPFIHHVLFLMSIVPLAANTVTLATELKVHPEKAALAVFLSTAFALIYIPLMILIFVP